MIYYKWALPLPDIRYSFEKTDIFPLLILGYNKDPISRFINIICKLADWLKLTDDMIIGIRLS